MLKQQHRLLVQTSLSELGFHVDKELNDYKISPAVIPGDNLMGTVWRITSQETSLILKTTHQTQAERDAFNSVVLFRNEIAFYRYIIPELSSLLSSKEPPLAAPRCYRVLCDGVNDALVLQDLSPEGYRMADRMTGLDAAHCSLALRELARLHALSFVMKAKYPDKFNQVKGLITEAFYGEDQHSNWSEITSQTFEDSALMIGKMLGEKYGDKIRKALKNGFKFFMDAVKGDEPFSVITHGDCWSNNLLYLYSCDNKPQNVYMIDFQISRYSSFGLDVMFLFCTSVRPDVLAMEYERFIFEYHTTLCAILETHGVTVIELDVVLSEIARCCTYGIAKAFVALPFFMRPASNVTSDSKLSTADVMTDVVANTKCKSEKCCQWLADIVKLFVDRGFIV